MHVFAGAFGNFNVICLPRVFQARGIEKSLWEHPSRGSRSIRCELNFASRGGLTHVNVFAVLDQQLLVKVNLLWTLFRTKYKQLCLIRPKCRTFLLCNFLAYPEQICCWDQNWGCIWGACGCGTVPGLYVPMQVFTFPCTSLLFSSSSLHFRPTVYIPKQLVTYLATVIVVHHVLPVPRIVGDARVSFVRRQSFRDLSGWW